MITSEKQLNDVIADLMNDLPSDSLLLFRGQNQLYKRVQSGKRRTNAFINDEVENGWNTIINRISNNEIRHKRYNQAILQHYGFPTHYIDLTSNPIIAAWFACNKYIEIKPQFFCGASLRFQDESTYNRIPNGVGYIIVFEIPKFQKMIRQNELFDMTDEKVFLRPNSQDAFLMIDQPPRLPDPNSFIKEILEIDLENFQSSRTLKDIFPSQKLDIGYARLLNVPYIQMPSLYFEPKCKNFQAIDFSDIENADKHIVFARRAIKIPIYVEGKTDSDFNPKREDFTLFEPSHFRLWKTIDVNISNIFEGQSGKLCDAAKITISPQALYSLQFDKESHVLQWPNIDSNSIFFTMADIDHDTVSEHSPPYYGVWLHKDGDLIIEIHIIVDEDDKLKFEIGHAYILSNNRIENVKIEDECRCGDIETHLKLIGFFLKIHSLNVKNKVALIQHPFGIEKWYVLI